MTAQSDGLRAAARELVERVMTKHAVCEVYDVDAATDAIHAALQAAEKRGYRAGAEAQREAQHKRLVEWLLQDDSKPPRDGLLAPLVEPK